MHYIIGDIHGCYDEMMKMISKINEQDTNAQIYFVGDFIDRGPNTKAVLDWCLENITLEGKYQAVLGNHEDMVIDWYEQKYIPYWEMKKENPLSRVSMPLTDYDFYYVLKENHLENNREEINKYIEWMKERPLHIDLDIEGKSYKIVHSWFWWETDSERIERNVCLWLRSLKGNYSNDTTIVHGHTTTLDTEYMNKEDRPGKICYRHNEINIDGGCVFGKFYDFYDTHLCAICLETQEEIYVETIR